MITGRIIIATVNAPESMEYCSFKVTTKNIPPNKPYIIESTYEGKPLSKCKLHNGKPIYNYDWFITFDAFKPGDYVCEEIADYVLNALPPRYWSESIIQCGEPTTSREDEKIGKMRNTYLTLKKIADGIWEYCGDCFVGETEMRGKEMQYV